MASRSGQYQPRQSQQSQQSQQQLQRPQQYPLQYSQPTSEQHYNGQAKPRTYSIHSQKTHQSSGSKHEYHETHEEKEAKRLHSKADPTLAMNEAEPAMVAAMKPETTQISLRSIQHKDPWGNPIADPDKSNPTRNRWERPLDTIRSFEAAIDGGYQRKSMYRADSATWNRRSSFHPASQPRFPQDSYYGSRPVSFRGDGQYGFPAPANARNSHYDNQNAGGYYNGAYDRGYGGHQVPRERSHRMNSDSPHYQVYGREQGVYPAPHKDRSYETVTSAAPSGNSDPTGYQTDPTSSDNSSIDRIPPRRKEPMNDYGIGFSNTHAYEAPTFSVGHQANSHPLPPPPPHGNSAQVGAPSAVPRRASLLRRQSTQQDGNTDKRKSWFSRRFSKNS
ncbi:uncharacterized protein UV8b_02658 [Ustilaginoidea virens]|uniref:DUF2406 domain protein n=1 Tax=Ustilaginoidea virens TaxID=1159556 RepID=A0A8E5HN83_USTVR|nr:uncharacterized protein UV8b_02658 [Ustilaginoidea virens]QUC18417.1 hypothetical protein UV8b_02658 [Ustilaginoidea virens]